MPLLILGGAWLAGTYAGHSVQPPLLLVMIISLASAGAATLWVNARRDRRSALALAAFLLGMARFEVNSRSLDAMDLSPHIGRAAVIMGVVDETPDRRSKAQRLTVVVRSIGREGREEPAAGRALITVPPLPERHYGDLLRLSGRLEAPPTFAGFDYREYLYRQGISAVMGYPRAVVVATGQGSALRALLVHARERLGDALAAHLSEPHAALAQGIVLGQRRNIPPDLSAAFARTGTTHLLAISGQNLTLAAALAVAWGSRVLGRRHPLYYLAVLGSLWGYALLAGLSASVLRATLMATLIVAAAGLGRPSGGLAPVVAAAAVMAAVDPLVLWDVGFQLSFLALAGVFFLGPLVEVAVWRLPGLRTLSHMEGAWRTPAAFIVAGLAATLGAALTTLPVVSSVFRTVPALALPATVFALPAFPIIMGAGALTALLALVHPFLATPFSWLTTGGTAWLLAVVQTWAGVPLAAVSVDRLPAVVWWIYTAVLFGIMTGIHRQWHTVLWRPRTPHPNVDLRDVTSRLQALLLPPVFAGLVLAGAVLAVGWGPPERGLRLWFLDAGGDVTVIRTPSGATVLIGGSPDPGALARALGQVLPFWQRSLDLALLPDPSQEHLPGLLMVLERYRIGEIMETETAGATAASREWERRVQERGIGRTRIGPGASIDLGDGLTLRVLAGPEEGGMALKVEGLGGTVLLLDRKTTRSLGRGGWDLGATQPPHVVKLAWRAGDPPPHPDLFDQARAHALIIAGTAPPSLEDTVSAPVYWVADRGTVELGWEGGAGWLRTGR